MTKSPLIIFPTGSMAHQAHYNEGLIGIEEAALPIHPTQLYEVAAMLFVFWILWKLRNHAHAMGWLAAVYLMAVGIERFLVEFIRAKDDRMLGVFTIAQVTSIILLTIGAALAMHWWKKDDFKIPEKAIVLSQPPPDSSSAKS